MSYEFPKDKPVTPGQDRPEKPSPGQQCPPDNNQPNPVPDKPTSEIPKQLEQYEE